MASNIIIRKAINKDKEQLKLLFEECFGNIAIDNGALTWIEGRYTIAEYNSKIIAVSGILNPEYSDYNGYEITWTCTKKEYRNQGLIVRILKNCEDLLPNDNISLYCDCWKIQNNQYANLHFVMEHLGMKKVMPERIKRIYPHNKECLNCPNKKENCYCHGDLYMKER